MSRRLTTISLHPKFQCINFYLRRLETRKAFCQSEKNCWHGHSPTSIKATFAVNCNGTNPNPRVQVLIRGDVVDDNSLSSHGRRWSVHVELVVARVSGKIGGLGLGRVQRWVSPHILSVRIF